MSAEAYPWYELVVGDDLQQGDILEGCPVFAPPSDLAVETLAEAVFAWEDRDVVVMSQTCDIVAGREKVKEVMLCPVWKRSELTAGYLATPRGMEEARRGNVAGFHVLAGCSLPRFDRDVRIVDFRRVYALPLGFIRRQAEDAEERLRLLPPYREHLAQALARFFMRIGLPVDIPPFK
jgi:hypothetical protein